MIPSDGGTVSPVECEGDGRTGASADVSASDDGQVGVPGLTREQVSIS